VYGAPSSAFPNLSIGFLSEVNQLILFNRLPLRVLHLHHIFTFSVLFANFPSAAVRDAGDLGVIIHSL